MDSPSLVKSILTALARLFSGILIIGLMFFWPAGTLRYWQAWMWLVTLIFPMLLVLVYLAIRDPALLARRMNMNETRSTQKRVIFSSVFVFLAIFLLPGFDVRFGWSNVPAWVCIAADGVVLAAYIFNFLVLKENSYASRTVEVQQGQQVISTGPYAIVRHPMYLSMCLLTIFSPLALGSYWAVIPTFGLVILLAARIRNEEELLLNELAGYREYTQKTRHRLFPGLW